MGYFKLGQELAKKGPEVIKSVKPLAKKLGAKSKQYWQNKASAARIKAAATDIEAVAQKAASTMGRLGSKEKRIKWYQKAANKKRYSKDYYKD